MRAHEVAAALRLTNRWWREPPGEWELGDPDLRRAAGARLRYAPRPLDGLVAGGLYVLRGPRRVGKSLEVKRAIARLLDNGVAPRRVLHAAVEGWDERDLGGLVRVGRDSETRNVVEPRFWFLDEVTAVRGDWPNRIKWLRDNTAFGDDCVVLTGSSARRFDEAAKALAGRRGDARDSDRLLLPMGFADFCQALGLRLPRWEEVPAAGLLDAVAADAVTALQPWTDELALLWESYLEVGGFPQAVDDWLRDHEVSQAFTDALWAVAHGDAISAERFSATQTQQLLGLLAGGLCSPVNATGLARELGTGRAVASSRIADLHSAFVTWPCHQDERGLPNLRAQAKVYFTDPLFARLAAPRRRGLAAPTPGALTEQQLGAALRRQALRRHADAYPRFDQWLYRRTATGQEIDFVPGSHPGVAVESRYTDGPWRRAAQTLLASAGGGVVATRATVDLDGAVRAIPAPLLAVLLEPCPDGRDRSAL